MVLPTTVRVHAPFASSPTSEPCHLPWSTAASAASGAASVMGFCSTAGRCDPSGIFTGLALGSSAACNEATEKRDRQSLGKKRFIAVSYNDDAAAHFICLGASKKTVVPTGNGELPHQHAGSRASFPAEGLGSRG